jgi:hypothetical protein
MLAPNKFGGYVTPPFFIQFNHLSKWSNFQFILGLHLSYLALGLISVHHIHSLDSPRSSYWFIPPFIVQPKEKKTYTTLSISCVFIIDDWSIPLLNVKKQSKCWTLFKLGIIYYAQITNVMLYDIFSFSNLKYISYSILGEFNNSKPYFSYSEQK